VSLYSLAGPGSPGDPGDLIAPVFIAAFDGWVDAGSAATTALEQLLDDAVDVATFDPDAFSPTTSSISRGGSASSNG
jgi:hypothetical protein